MKKNYLTASALTLGAAMFASAPAYAQQKTAPSSANVMMKYFDEASVKQALKSLDAPIQTHTQANGQKFFVMTYDNTNIVIKPAACKAINQQCEGLNMFISFAKPAEKSEAYLLERTRAFNWKYDAGKVTIIDGKSIVVSRYLISSYGIPMGNVFEEVVLLRAMAAAYVESLDLS